MSIRFGFSVLLCAFFLTTTATAQRSEQFLIEGEQVAVILRAWEEVRLRYEPLASLEDVAVSYHRPTNGPPTVGFTIGPTARENADGTIYIGGDERHYAVVVEQSRVVVIPGGINPQ